MKVSELKVGSWYKVKSYGDIYKYGGQYGPHIRMEVYISNGLVNSTSTASNSQFWENADEIDQIEDYNTLRHEGEKQKYFHNKPKTYELWN